MTWTIQMDGSDPRDAAERALRSIRDSDSIATVFTVDGEEVDLLDD
ncbi:MAG: hypothetical protein WAX14_08360 [Rhodococcus sp. (in: high G+C Gram-positive bacteria)]